MRRDLVEEAFQRGVAVGRWQQRIEEKQPRDAWLVTPCPVCNGTTEHVLGCPEMDKPR